MNIPTLHDLLWFYPGDEIPWDTLVDDRKFVIELNDVQAFLDTMPDRFQPATAARPSSGLPKNVWVGGPVTKVWPAILDVRSRIRFLTVDSRLDERRLKTCLEAWRCSNCGRRGVGPRPRVCPHAASLCGDAKLVPQIDWVVDRGAARRTNLAAQVRRAGALYWPEEIPHVR